MNYGMDHHTKDSKKNPPYTSPHCSSLEFKISNVSLRLLDVICDDNAKEKVVTR
jgi:hypothetical protein